MIIYLSISEDNPKNLSDEEENNDSDLSETADSIELYDPTENTSLTEENTGSDDNTQNSEDSQNIENSENAWEQNGKTQKGYFDSCNCVEGVDYIVTENKIRITALGMGKMYNSSNYDWMYENDLVGSVPPQDFIQGYPEYKEGVDYTVDDENRIVNILSEDCYQQLKKCYPSMFI